MKITSSLVKTTSNPYLSKYLSRDLKDFLEIDRKVLFNKQKDFLLNNKKFNIDFLFNILKDKEKNISDKCYTKEKMIEIILKYKWNY